jgi:hypothetical protein
VTTPAIVTTIEIPANPSEPLDEHTGISDSFHEDEDPTAHNSEEKLLLNHEINNFLREKLGDWIDIEWETHSIEMSTSGTWFHSVLGKSVCPSWTNKIIEYISTRPSDQWKELALLQEEEVGQEYLPFVKRLCEAFKKAGKTIRVLERKRTRVEDWTSHGVTPLVNHPSTRQN